jgi:Tol biopolymer transport system component
MKNNRIYRPLAAGAVLLLAILACSPFQTNVAPQPTQTIGSVDTPVVIQPTQTQLVLPPTATLTSAPTENTTPVKLAYVIGSTFEAEDADIYVANEDGSGAVCVACEACSETEPSLSSDGQFVVYQGTCSGYPDLFIVNSNLSGWTANVTNTPDLSEREPDFSYDGLKIAFRVNPPNEDRNKNGEIFVMNADGSGKQVLGIWGRGPAWSPDGSQLAYMSNESGTWQIYVYTFSTGQTRQLTNEATNCRWPAWRADGEVILYNTTLSAASMDPADIWSIASDGSGVPQLVVDLADGVGRPSWSSRGFIAFNAIYGLGVRSPTGVINMLVADDEAWAPDYSH